MKKSFLKRAMAAAIAVPVALSQTVMFASFAEGEDTADKIKLIDMDTFMKVESDLSKNAPVVGGTYMAPEAANANAIIQESKWNEKTAAALAATLDTTVQLDPAEFVDSIKNTAGRWYVDILKDAAASGAMTVEAVVKSDTVVVTAMVDYNIGQALADAVAQAVPEQYKDVELNIQSDETVKGVVTVTFDTANLATAKNIPAVVEVNLDGFDKTKAPIDAAIDYVQTMLDNAKVDVQTATDNAVAKYRAEAAEKQALLDEKQAALDELTANGAASAEIDNAQAELDAAQAELDAAVQQLNDAEELADEKIDQVFNKYQGQFDTAKNKVTDIADNVNNKTYEAGNVDDLYEQVRADIASKSQAADNRLPDSVGDATDGKYYVKAADLFGKVIARVNAAVADKGYEIDITADDILTTAKGVENITATIQSGGYVYNAEGYGYVEDEVTDLSAYKAYFNEQLADQNLEVVEVYSTKVVEMKGEADANDLTGEGYFNVYRVVWYEETKEKEEPSTDPTGDTSDTDPTGDTSDTDPTGDTSDTDPTGDTSNTDPTGDTSNTDPTGDTSNTDPTGDTSNTDPTGDTSNTDPTGDTDPTDTTGRDDVTIDVGAQVRGGFYFSHDPQAFNAEDLVASATVKVTDEDGNVKEEAADMSKFSFKFYQTAELSDEQKAEAPVSPQSAFADGTLNQTGAYVAQTLYVYYEGQYVSNGMLPVYIGVKGDANLDGVANATDAARVLIYAAEVGANGESTLYSEDNAALEKFAYFLADTNGESYDGGATSNVPGATGKSVVNASDAAQILIYAAVYGANKQCDWIPEVINAPYPTYSEKIAKAAGLID